MIEGLKEINGTEDTVQHGTEPEQLINVHEAATILGVKVRWLYENYHRFPFTRRIGVETSKVSCPLTSASLRRR